MWLLLSVIRLLKIAPVWLGQGKRLHRSFPDPAKAEGSEQEVLAVFRQVRDAIAVQIPELLGAEQIEK